MRHYCEPMGLLIILPIAWALLCFGLTYVRGCRWLALLLASLPGPAFGLFLAIVRGTADNPRVSWSAVFSLTFFVTFVSLAFWASASRAVGRSYESWSVVAGLAGALVVIDFAVAAWGVFRLQSRVSTSGLDPLAAFFVSSWAVWLTASFAVAVLLPLGVWLGRERLPRWLAARRALAASHHPRLP
jgi:hypothetical protein